MKWWFVAPRIFVLQLVTISTRYSQSAPLSPIWNSACFPSNQYGTTPFKGSNRNETFSKILKLEVEFPACPPPNHNTSVSNSCRSLVRKLLHKDEHKRLGCRAGAADVKQQAWFKPINWALLRHCEPPIIPIIKQPNGIDAVNFRKMAESLSFDLDKDNAIKTAPIPTNPSDSDKNPFEKFSSGR